MGKNTSRENATSILERDKTLSKEFKEILKDVSLRLILKDKCGKQHCLPICWFQPGYFLKRGNNRRLRLFRTLCIGISRKSHLHLAKILQNGAKLIKKLTPGFKNHITNLDKFRQGVESPKSRNLMSYFCPKNTLLQLKHYVQRINLTLLSTTFMKSHQITYVIFEIISCS